MDLTDLENKIRPISNQHMPVTRLICLEQTHANQGGRVLPLSYFEKVFNDFIFWGKIICLFRGFHQAQLHFTNIYNRYESKDEGSANGHEVPARQTPKYIDNITFKTDKNTRDSTTENSVDGPAVGANSFPCPWVIRVKVIV